MDVETKARMPTDSPAATEAAGHEDFTLRFSAASSEVEDAPGIAKAPGVFIKDLSKEDAEKVHAFVEQMAQQMFANALVAKEQRTRVSGWLKLAIKEKLRVYQQLLVNDTVTFCNLI